MAAITQLRVREAAREFALVAEEADVDFVLLKGAAMEFAGVVDAGSRPMADLDVLIRRGDARPLVAALVARGWQPNMGEAYAHHFAPLAHPLLGALELHIQLPGVALNGARRFVTYEDLRERRLLEPCPELGAQAHTPTRAALLAHLLAHGLAQHGFRPDAYAPLRLVGDLIDLDVGSAADAPAVAAAKGFVAGAVPEREVTAAVALAGRLASGRAEVLNEHSDAGTLLRHLIAATLDDGYRASLKLQELSHPLTAGSRIRGRAATAWTAMALSRRQLDAIYGSPRHVLGYTLLRMWRPFDLLRRAVRSRRSLRVRTPQQG